MSTWQERTAFAGAKEGCIICMQNDQANTAWPVNVITQVNAVAERQRCSLFAGSLGAARLLLNHHQCRSRRVLSPAPVG